MNSPYKHTPWIKTVVLELNPPSLKDNTADVDRLVRGIRQQLKIEHVIVDFSLVKSLPNGLRKCEYRVTAVLFEDNGNWYLIDVFPTDVTHGLYGLGVDLGTTTVVVRLLDLVSGAIKEETSFHNPQMEHGTDILTRIHFSAKDGGLIILQHLLIERLNTEINTLANKNNISPESIVGISAAGNTTMTHLFLGLDPFWICREPYIPVINRPEIIKAAALGLDVNPWAPVLVFPNVASYFGGDLVAGILACDMMGQSEISLLVDIGTNAEVAIGNCDWLMACAGAAGPALEGDVADMGMMAVPGVIDKVSIDPFTSEFNIRTIGDQPPIGICGSGLIDLVAQLFMTGMIDMSGKFVPDRCENRLIEIDGIKHIVIVFPEDTGGGEMLTLSQTDIYGVIRSKAAMYTILTTITNTVNITMKQISRFFIAGTFGSYIDPRSAITIGMIPDLPIETYISLGNTCIKGACMALLSAQAKKEILQIRDQITYIELNVNQEFMNLFSAAKFIPHTDRSLFPTVTNA